MRKIKMKGSFHLAIGAMGMFILFLVVYVVVSQVNPPAGDSIARDIGQLVEPVGRIIRP